MGKIRILDEAVSARIAAGEIIERPASVVKELLENALDANASSVTISITEGGISGIRVTDNGNGIESDDMPLAVLKHSTSKIRTLDDLNSLITMGFRGEALASISAVSMLTIKSRTKNSDFGTELYAKGGKVESVKESGLPEGTTVLVENLFYNTPARLKFLKKPSAEASAVTDLVTRIALARPNVSIRYISNDKTIFHTPGNGRTLDVISCVYGFGMRENLIMADHTQDGMAIYGYISKPGYCFKTSKYGNIFINNRYIKSELISKAVNRAYGERMLKGDHPFYILYMEIAPDRLDVNVHPNKLQVHFSDEAAVESAVLASIGSAFTKAYRFKKLTWPGANIIEDLEETTGFTFDLDPQMSDENIEMLNMILSEDETEGRIPSALEEPADYELDELDWDPACFLPPQLEGRTFPPVIPPSTYRYGEEDDKEEVEEEQAEEEKEGEQAFFQGFGDMLEIKILGAAFSSYIIAEQGESLYFIDQHAAHERKIYDHLMESVQKRVISQRLLFGAELPIDHEEANILEENMDVLNSMGFEFESVDERKCVVIALPQILGDIRARALLQDILQGLGELTVQKDIALRRDLIAKAACKAAVKAGQLISNEDIGDLIHTVLDRGVIPHCPHGRPIVTVMTKTDLEVAFRRIV